MSVNSGVNAPFNSLPKSPEALDADGNFRPVVNITPNTFNTPSGVTEQPFNATLIGDSSANIVGTTTTPYLPVALPAYIPTLYTNVYNIQTSLTDSIPLTDVSSNRIYPSIYAVKNYVQTQLSGSQTLQAGIDNTNLKISTGLTNTILVGVSNLPTGSTGNVLFSNDNGVTTYTNWFDINSIDSARSGANKVIVNASALSATYFMTVQLTGSKYFLVNNKKYKVYQFSIAGDVLNMVQYVATSTTAPYTTGDNIFFVLSYGGVFSQLVA
jgi:hypothetical protein